MDTKKAATDQCANTDPPPNTSRYPGATDVPTAENNRAPKGKRTRRNDNGAPAAPLTDDEQRVLSRGIAFLMFCAAAISFPTIYGLARLIGFDYRLAYLLPAAIDGYAVTSIWFGRRVRVAHPAAKAARRNSRLALAITIACNGLYHLLTLGGTLIPAWGRLTLLVAVSSMPPFLVDRLLHLRALAAGTGAAQTANAFATDGEAERQQPSAKASADRQRAALAATANANTPSANTTANTTANTARVDGPATAKGGVNTSANDTGNGEAAKGRTDTEWVEIAKSVYVRERDRLGKRPPEGAFHAALCAELARLAGVDALAPEDTPSLGTAKRVRGLVEAAFPELAPAIHPVAS